MFVLAPVPGGGVSMAPVVQAITEHLESALNLLEAAIPETPKRRSRKAPQKEA